MYPKNTIAAISTPLGEGGIGIVRVSGEKSLEIVASLFESPKGFELKEKMPYSMAYGFIVDPKSRKHIDEVLVSIMRAPASYTAEDVVEVNCHGGIVALKKVLELILEKGATLAEPGEFTKRAFLNGRIDLAQAESVIDIIRSQTELGLNLSMQQLEGGLSQRVDKWRQELLKVAAHLEAAVDFSDEDPEVLPRGELGRKLEKVTRELERILRDAKGGKILREGVSTVIVGRPNVGKSSLLNALLRENRAIVTAIPGTTRDVIEEVINIGGIPLKIRDTAGIRNPANEIEELGVERSRQSLLLAELVLYVVDGSETLRPEDFSIGKEISDNNKDKVLVTLNKKDLPTKVTSREIREKLGFKEVVEISATKEIGLEKLQEIVAEMVFSGSYPSLENTLIASVRHSQALKKARERLSESLEILEKNFPEEIVITPLKDALDSLGDITGETVTEEVLDRIFSEFCVGK